MALTTAASVLLKLLNRLDRIAGDGPRYPDVVVRVPRDDDPKALRTVPALLGRISNAVQSSNADVTITRRFIAEVLSGPSHPTAELAYRSALNAARRWFRVVAV